MSLTQNHKVFFVTPEYIFQNYAGYLDSNIDANSLNSFILKAEFKETQYALGYTLYEKYINLIQTGDIFLPENNYYQLLLNNFIMDEVACYTIWYALDWLHYRVTNKAVVNKYSQWSSASSETELNRIKFLIYEDAQHWDSKIREEILNYPNAFPEYFTQIGVYRPPSKTNPYDNFFISGKPRLWGSDMLSTSQINAGQSCCGN